jgi:PAS domain S-box-containing protein
MRAVRDRSALQTSWLPEALGAFLACADADSLFEALLQSVRSVAPVAVVNLCHLIEGSRDMEISRCWAEKSRFFRPGLRFALEQSLLARTFEVGRPLYFPDYEEVYEPPPFAREVMKDGVRASLVVPLSLRGQTRGSVNFGFRVTNPLDAESRHLFVALAQSYGALHFWMHDATALEASEERFRALVEFLPEMICYGRGRELEYMNPAGLAMLGLPDSLQSPRLDVLSFVAPEDRGRTAAFLRGHRAGQRGPDCLTATLVRADGSRFLAEVRATQVRIGGQRRIQVLLRDVTEQDARRRALERNQAAETALGQVGLVLLEPGDFAASLRRALGILVEESGAYAALLAVSDSEHPPVVHAVHQVTGSPPLPAVEGRLAAALDRVIRATTQFGEPITGEETAAPGADPKELGLTGTRATAHVLFPLGRGNSGILALFRSTPGCWDAPSLRLLSLASRMFALALERHLAEEERGRAEERLRRSQTLEAVGQLAGGIAHDFNNILGSLLSCVYLMQTESGDDASRQQELRQMTQLCKRGGDLTSQLLAFARHVPGRRQRIDPAGLVREVLELLSRTLEKTIHVRCEVVGSPATIRADRSMLTTAVINLCLNARDAMSDGGCLTVGTEQTDEGVAILVRDTGPGIPDEIRERIFEPFFTTKPPGRGTGLGLSMVYATCREAGGSVTVEHPAAGGTTFRLLFPPATDGELQEDGTGAHLAPHPLTEKTVLVVEDEEDIAKALLHNLSDRGYRVARASTGIEALEKVETLGQELGLVILDLVLPEISGRQVLRILTSLVPQVPMLVVTGRADLVPEEVDVPLLPKPFGVEEVLEAVARVLTPGPGA